MSNLTIIKNMAERLRLYLENERNRLSPEAFQIEVETLYLALAQVGNIRSRSMQPIETARKEPHAFLLLFDLDWYVGWWHMKQGWQTHGPYGVKQINPTHWLPIPESPE